MQTEPALCLLRQLRWKSTFNLPNTFLKVVLTASTVYTLCKSIIFRFSHGIDCCFPFYSGQAPKSGSEKRGFSTALMDSSYSYTVISPRQSCSEAKNNRIGSVKHQLVQPRRHSIVDRQTSMVWKIWTYNELGRSVREVDLMISVLPMQWALMFLS